MLERIIWMVPLLPLLAACMVGADYLTSGSRREAGERRVARVSLSATLLSLLLMLLLAGGALVSGTTPGQIVYGGWIRSGEYGVMLSLHLDSFAIAMALLVSMVSLLMLRFSVNYMHREAGFHRFFLVMNLFVGAMLLIVMAGSAVFTFIGWELAGVSSFLLIGYAFNRQEATANANRAFITNRIGDAGFITGIFFAFSLTGSVEWPRILLEGANLPTLSTGLLVAGFLLAALVKSALVPFAPWIARALEGPTPSSAIFYGSLMSHAGIYLVIRMQPLFEQAPLMLLVLVLIGILTAFYGYICALVQTDVKSAMIFSSTAHIGLMLLACGLGWFGLATIYLFAHAIWRAYQFLHAPWLIHLASRGARPVPGWLHRREKLYAAGMQRFWLEHIANWLLVKPTYSLSRDLQEFDDNVVNRMVGMPSQVATTSYLTGWKKREGRYITEQGDVGRGRGLFGTLMEWVASAMHWFEERLVLHGGGEGLLKGLEHIGSYLQRVEELLAQPRYLLLMIMATFVAII